MPVPRLDVRRRGPLRGHPLPGADGDAAAARRPGDAVGGRGTARLGLARPRTDDDAAPTPAVPRPRRPGGARPRSRRPARCSTTSTRRWSTPGIRWRSPASCGPGGWLQVRLLGRTWTAAPRRRRRWPPIRPASASGSASALIWLAPAEPADADLEVPGGARPPVRQRAGCRRCAPRARPDRSPTRCSTPRTCRSSTRPRSVRPTSARSRPGRSREPGGFRSVQEQWCDNPLDPEVATGGRPLRSGGARPTPTGRPFQLRLRQEFLDAGATSTIAVPAAAGGPRLDAALRLRAALGRARAAAAPPAAVSQADGAAAPDPRRRTSRSLATLAVTGCRWTARGGARARRRPGVALRQALCDFTAVGRRQLAA